MFGTVTVTPGLFHVFAGFGSACPRLPKCCFGGFDPGFNLLALALIQWERIDTGNHCVLFYGVPIVKVDA